MGNTKTDFLNNDTFTDDDLTTLDIFDSSKGSKEDHKKRKERLEALDKKRFEKSLRNQIDYLYDKHFIKLSHQSQSKKQRV